jgi:hypothetical protein
MDELKDIVQPTTNNSLDTHIVFFSGQNTVWVADIAGLDEFSK